MPLFATFYPFEIQISCPEDQNNQHTNNFINFCAIFISTHVFCYGYINQEISLQFTSSTFYPVVFTESAVIVSLLSFLNYDNLSWFSIRSIFLIIVAFPVSYCLNRYLLPRFLNRNENKTLAFYFCFSDAVWKRTFPHGIHFNHIINV